MKRLSLIHTLIAGILVISLLGPSGFAEKKLKIDSLKYPELNPMKLPTLEKTQLENGIKLRLIKDDKLPIVTVYARFKGGTAYDPVSRVGLASMTSQLLKIGGTKSMKSEDLDRLLDANGITISFSEQEDYFQVRVTCLDEKLDQAIALLAQMLKEPAFDKEKLEEIKTQASSAIGMRNISPDGINAREFKKLVYGDKSPFAAVQEYEHVDNIEREDVIKMYQMFFAPDNMLVGLVGPLEMADVEKIFKSHLGDWQVKSNIPPFPEAQDLTYDFKVGFAEKSDLNQCYLTIGHLGEKYSLEERAKITIFNSIFSEGFSSRLMSRIRVKMGLTYGVNGGIDRDYFFRGRTYFATYTKSETALDAVKAIQEEIDLIRNEKVTAQELEDAKNFYLNSFVFRYSTPSDILLNNLKHEFYGFPEDADKKFLEDVKKVTVEDIQEVAQKCLHPDKMIIFIVGNEKGLKGDLASLGPVKKIDISIKPPALKEKIPEATPETLAKGQEVFNAAIKKNYGKFLKLKSMKATGTMKATMQGQTFEIGLELTTVFPDKSYSQMTVMGMKIEMIVNGNQGLIKQMGQEHAIPAEDLEKEQISDLHQLTPAMEKYNFQYLKEEEVNQKKYDVIYVFAKENAGNWVKFFINKETQLIEITEKISNNMGVSGVFREVQSEFKMIQGIPVSHKKETYMKEQKVVDVVITDVQINPVVDPALFTIPKK